MLIHDKLVWALIRCKIRYFSLLMNLFEKHIHKQVMNHIIYQHVRILFKHAHQHLDMKHMP